jgi:type II secretory pathway component PulM
VIPVRRLNLRDRRAVLFGALVLRDRRALLFGALVLVPVLTFREVVQPYLRARTALVERVRTQRGLLARELAVLAAAPRLPERRAQAEAVLAADAPRLFPGTEPFAATAELVGYIGEAARRSRVLVQGLQSRSVPPEPGMLVQLHVDLRGETDFEGVLRLLQAIERGPRLVRVDALVIQTGGDRPGGRETIAVRAALSGYVAAAPPPSDRPDRPDRVVRAGL